MTRYFRWAISSSTAISSIMSVTRFTDCTISVTQVRAPDWQADFLSRPLAERKREIEVLRTRSETEKRIKPMAIMDVNPSAVEAALRRHGVHVLIHGHTHRQGRHTHQVDGRPCIRWVLGDWHPERGSALLCSDAGWRFV